MLSTRANALLRSTSPGNAAVKAHSSRSRAATAPRAARTEDARGTGLVGVSSAGLEPAGAATVCAAQVQRQRSALSAEGEAGGGARACGMSGLPDSSRAPAPLRSISTRATGPEEREGPRTHLHGPVARVRSCQPQRRPRPVNEQTQTATVRAAIQRNAPRYLATRRRQGAPAAGAGVVQHYSTTARVVLPAWGRRRLKK